MAQNPLRIFSSIHPLHAPGEPPEAVAEQARAAEQGGVERVLVGYGSPNPDGWIVSSFILANTTRLGVLLAHRPGVMHPVVAARQAATLHYISRGRLALNVVTGGSPGDQLREGDLVEHDDRYRRSIEYVKIMRALWEASSPITHEGEFYSFTRALLVRKPWEATPPEIFMGGASEAAVDFGVSSSDVYMLWGEPLQPTSERLDAVRARERALGRTVDGFSMSFRLVVGETSEEAWALADATVAKYEDKSGRVKTHADDIGRSRQLEIARSDTRQDTNFWAGITLATGGQGSTSALVGTEEEIVQSLAAYRELGINAFLLTGPDGVWTNDLAPVVTRVKRELA
jgi:alkanesulfonate monooxygenase